MKRVLCFFAFVSLSILSSSAVLHAADLAPITADDGEREGRKFRDVSPDGRYALLITYDGQSDDEFEDRADLIDKKSGKVLAKIHWEESDNRNGRDIHLLWSADSERVAVYTGGRRYGFTTIYAKAGAAFKVVPMPKFPKLPEEPSAAFVKKHHWKSVKVTTVAEATPEKWLKSGELVINYSTALAGSTGSWSYEYTLTIGFGKKGGAILEKAEHEEKFDE